MITPSRYRKVYVTIGTFVAIIIFACIAWNASIIEHLSSATQKQTFTIDCEFDRFRQIMVRKNATAAIVGHSGMRLVSEKVQNIELDTSGDDRPLLNAIRGKSKSEVSAVKIITVRLDDPALEASELVLRQVADIHASEIDVTTQSTGPTGRLEHYATSLNAQPDARGTQVTISVEMGVRVKVPKLFVSRADARVQNAADDAITGQAIAMKQFIVENADQRVILPDL